MAVPLPALAHIASRTKAVLRPAVYAITGFPILALCYLLRPVKLVRFGHLYSSRIGHLCYNPDNYFAGRRERRSSELAIFTRDRTIANQTIFAMWRRQPDVWFTQLAKPAVWLLHNVLPNSPARISFAEMHPTVSSHSASPPIAELTESELARGADCLRKHGIERPFICVHNRDSAYLDHHGGDGNIHDYRDFEFDDLAPAIDRALDLGYSVIRLGEIVKSPARIDRAGFFELTGAKRSDFSDVFLLSACSFFVGGATGLSNVSRILRKPELLINYIPFRLPELSAWAAGSIFIPKKLRSLESGRYLRFSEMVALPYDIHYKGDFFGDRGLEVVDNTPEEIADGMVEMESRAAQRWTDTPEQARLQEAFWASLAGHESAGTIRDALEMRVGSRFLELNNELI